MDYVNYVIVTDSCTSITGKAYLDEDSSCTFTPGDIPLPNLMAFAVKNNQPAGFAYTDALGNYTLWVPPSYDVFLSTVNLQSVLQPACNTTLAGNGLLAPDSNNHFIFSCPPGYDAQINSSSTLLAQTVYRGLYFSVKNNSCTSYNNATVTFYLDNRIIPSTTDSAVIYFNNGSFTPQLISPVISGNTVSIPGVHVTPVGIVSGYIYAKADPLQTTLNDTVCFRVTVTPDSGDINPANNADTVCAQVVTSYDPNDKNGQSNGRSVQGIIQPNQDVIYTIRFQNTGNFPAKDVRIVDTLDANLNLASITILSHSHPMKVQQSGNVVVFLFNDIWLPDSVSSEPESHGHVTFRIAQQPDLAPLTAISNFADIYFDYNPPIRTNTVVSVIESPTALPVKAETGRAIVYPNPVRERFTIKMAEMDTYSVKIYDLMGRAIIQEQIQGMQWEWNNRPLPGGFYLIEITHLPYRQVLKLVIED
ncbi:MAG: hypothetical protein KatS3mg031_2257 [Chitinophagales bacterium]|nr:MAG: hypothetical protein KatS3mg031_2257 [Chitinophagales bacterium]